MSLEELSKAIQAEGDRRRAEMAEFTRRMGKPDAVIGGLDCWVTPDGVIGYRRTPNGMLDRCACYEYPKEMIDGLYDLLHVKRRNT